MSICSRPRRSTGSSSAEKKLSVAIGHALANSSGMLYASLLPSVPLILGAFSLMRTDDAVTLSLLIAMLVLGALGYNALGERGKHPVLRVLGAIGTAFFGFLVIVLNTAVH